MGVLDQRIPCKYNWGKKQKKVENMKERVGFFIYGSAAN